MGYMIVRVTNKISARPFIAWVDDEETPIARKMAAWLTEGETMEILDYQPNRDSRLMQLIPELNLWGDHMKEQDDEQ